MGDGWVKLHRKMLINPMLRDDHTSTILFITLLMLVDRKTGTYKTGRFQLATLVNMNPNTVYKSLKRLEKMRTISLFSNNKVTRISICNWDAYQSDSNNKVTAEQQQSNTKQEVRKRSNNTIDFDLLNLLNKKTSRNFRTLPSGYKITLETFSLEEIGTALDHLVASDWYKNTDGGLSSSYMLRKSTIDDWLNRSSGKNANINVDENGSRYGIAQ